MQSTINRQSGNGFVLEYITLNFGSPNPGFETDQGYRAEKLTHAESAGRLVAVHRLRPLYRPLRSLLGVEEFERLQDMWAEGGNRRRWSVAFPIIESYDITSRPRANEIFSTDAMQRLFAHPSATLRPLNDGERLMIANLPLTRRESSNAWVAIEDEIAMAQGSDLPKSIIQQIDKDLGISAPEGMTTQRWVQVRLRAAWVANDFIKKRRRERTFRCDRCSFDPAVPLAETSINVRSLLDVHHKHPLAEGIRRTDIDDFALLCPTCHRIEHLLLKHRAR